MRELPTGTVTLLFTDIEGSTRLLQQLGERYASVLEACRYLMRAAFLQFHGHEVDTQGDAFFVAFARATDAVSAAVAAQRALSNHAWPEGVMVRVRMGLHTGEPQLSSEGYVGLDVHQAARIMSAGHGGQVLLSRTTSDLVEHTLPEDVSLLDLGTYRLKDVRLVTLTGPGGVGKTRLALQVAAELSEHFVDGTWFVSLASFTDPDLVIPAIAQTLDIRETGERSLLDQLKASLRERQVLLLLDNFEQVASAATQLADLLGACSRLNILVTSREALHVRAEQEFPVPALALPDPKHLPDLATLSQYEAVAIFIERAQAVQPDFQVTNANAPSVAEICGRLDGLPLAIELAAARIKLFPPQVLLTRLGQRLPLLTSSIRDAPARQRTLRQTIQWSYDLLSAQEQRLFRRLSVFVDGCTWQAIVAVSATFGDDTTLVFDTVASLIDKNLLRQTTSEGEDIRLTMLETIHEYGQECLAASREMDTTREAHAAYYLTLAEEAKDGFKGPQQAEWSLEPAQTGSNPDMALRFCATLNEFWEVRGLYSEGRAALEQALADCEGASTSARASALSAAARFAAWLSDNHRAEALLQESLVLYRELGDTRGIAFSLQDLAWIVSRRGASIAARQLLEESVTLMRELGDMEALAWSLFFLADTLGSQGEYGRANALFEEMLALHTELGNKGGMAIYFWISGWVAFSRGDAATAYTLMEQSLVLQQEMGARWQMFWPIAALGRFKAYQGDVAASLAFHEQSLELARELNDDWVWAFCLEGWASVVATQGKCAWAARLWGVAESLRERCGIPLPPLERVDYEPAVAAARVILGEQAFAAAWAEGRTMTLDQVLDRGFKMGQNPIL